MSLSSVMQDLRSTGNCKDRICQANQSDFIINILAVMRVTDDYSIVFLQI